MIYTQVDRNDCDNSFKIGYAQVLCYTKNRLYKISPQANVVGEVVINKTDKVAHSGPALKLLGDILPLKPVGKTNRLIYQSKGYLPVGENEYIQVFESRRPFLITLASMAALSTIILGAIFIIPRGVPNKNVELINPLPQVDPYAIPDPDAKNNDYTVKVPQGGGSVDFTLTPMAELDLQTGEIKMDFTNPKTSSHAAVLELFIVYDDMGGNKQELQIALSGLLLAGKKLETMNFDMNKKPVFVKNGSYHAKYKVQYYDPNTGIQSVVNAEYNDIVLEVKGVI